MGWTPLVGAWAVLPDWLAAHKGQLLSLCNGPSPDVVRAMQPEARTFTPRDLISRTSNDLAVIPLHGPMIKRAGFWEMLFGFTGTDTVREALQYAGADQEIKGILLQVESPGGHVAGVHELAQAVRTVAQTKPVLVHMDDIGASAAYWASTHATKITASPTTEVGSLGTMAVVVDESKLANSLGITVHVVSTGTFKGMGVSGTPIEPDHLAEIERRVAGINAFFMRDVRQGRKLTAEQFTQATDGRVFLAQDAKALGLIDEVRSFSSALRELGRLTTTSRGSDTRAHIAARRTALEGLLHGGSDGSENQTDYDPES